MNDIEQKSKETAQKDLAEGLRFGTLSRRNLSRAIDRDNNAFQYGWLVGVNDSRKPFEQIAPIDFPNKSRKYSALFQSGHRLGFGDRFVPWENLVHLQK